MRTTIGLVLTVAALAWVRHIGTVAPSTPHVTAIAVGFTLLAAWIAGDVVRRLRLPRITGYLVLGMAIGPYLGNVVTEAMTSQLQIVVSIATSLIALMAGLMLNVNRLGVHARSVLRLTAVTLLVTLAGIAIITWLAWPWLGIAPDAGGWARLAIVLMFGLVASSFSPTMTAAVITETGARGRLPDLVLAMVVLADLVLLVAFSIGLPIVRDVTGTGIQGAAPLLIRLAWEAGGAVAFGVFLGALFALYLRYVGREVTLVLVAVCAVLSQVGTSQDFQPLLAAVAAGFVIENLAVAQGDRLRSAIQRSATPVLLIFFVSVGTALRPDLLITGGAAAALFLLVRLALLRVAVRAGRRTGDAHPADAYAWTGLVSQAGITLGFAATLASEFPVWGVRIQMLMVAMLAVNELLGPVLFRYGLACAEALEPYEPSPLIVVSNREPYVHQHSADGITAVPTTGGVAVALDALMRQRGGVWIAHGGGDADRDVVDGTDKILVPPEAPSYQLRRVWIDELTFSAYYGGFANEGLWPLCHQVDVRPAFRPEEWTAYREVNDQFAAVIDQEMRHQTTPVFIQDYHLALVAPALRRRRSEARTALFWHIPWPNFDRLRICPWYGDLVEGLLGNDLLAFQLERDRHNFIEAAEAAVGARFESEASRFIHRGRSTTVASVPIGVDFDRIQTLASAAAIPLERQRLMHLFGLTGRVVGVGVDRLDYTKGIPERLAAIDCLLDQRPDLRDRLTFVQVGVPSRSELRDYAAVEAAIGSDVEALNAKHAPRGGPPVVRYHRSPLGLASLVALYQLADFCVVSSLHDGMNLVAKEFVASRQDEDGVLLLSSLAGSAQELTDALVINPYDTSSFTAALIRAIEMPRSERRARMRAMRQVVAGRDVFLWASDILEGLENLWDVPLHRSIPQWEATAM